MSDLWKKSRGYYPGDWVRPRSNGGSWRPLVDWTEVFPGHRSVDRKRQFNLYDAPVDVRLAIEEAEGSEPLEFDGQVDDLGNSVKVWKSKGGYHLLYYEDGRVAYASSEDAFHWRRPSLGIVEKNGSTENNLVTEVGGDALKCVFEDPTAPPNERFKGMGCEGALLNSATWEVANEGEDVNDELIEQWWADQEYLGPSFKGPRLVLKGRVIGWTSPDRIHWKRCDRILANFPMDGGLSISYDESSGFFYGYCRLQGVPQEQFDLMGKGKWESEIFHRAIGLTQTRDFLNWSAPKLVLFPDGQDPPDTSFYGGDYFSHPGLDDLHCMLVQVYHHITDHMDSQIAFSRDGVIWQRPERRAIIPAGVAGSNGPSMVYSWGSGIVELPDGLWGSLFGAHNKLHNEPRLDGANSCSLRWARWKPFRFCGIESKAEGRFTIATIKRTADELRLNYHCKPGGWIEVEILRQIPSRVHPDVDPVTGFTFTDSDRLTGDSIDSVVTWGDRSDLSEVGEMLAVRLKMFQAKIFAYRI